MTITRIQLRRDVAADWTAADPTLAAGELGVETDTGKIKIGDGSTAWTALNYLLEDAALEGTPTAPTAAPGTDTTQVATTEFVTDAVDNATYAMVAPASPVNAAQDTANAAAILAGGGPLIFRSGEYRLSDLAVPAHADLRGAGQSRTTLRNLTGSVLVVAGSFINVRDLLIVTDGGDSAVKQSGGLSESTWERFQIVQDDDDFSCWDNLGYEFVNNRFASFSTHHKATATVPSWKLVGAGGTINDNQWERGRHTGTGLFGWWVEPTDANAQYANVWRAITFEVCVGGGIKLLGNRNYVIEDCTNWDIGVGLDGINTQLQNFFDLDVGPVGGIDCVGTIRRAQRLGGTLDAGVVDIALPTAGGGYGTIIDSCHNVNSVDPLVVETRGNQCTVIHAAPQDYMSLLSTGQPLRATRLGGIAPWELVAAFDNDWVNADVPAAYRLTPDGFHVELRGNITGGANATTAFTLPAGFRPASGHSATALNGTTGGLVGVVIATTGVVTLYGGDPADVRTLSGIVFALD